jgi:hypothetical protein
MPLSFRDTQAFTNVPNSRDIGELASLYETEALIQGLAIPNGAQGITNLPSLVIPSTDVLLNAIQPGSSGATTIRFPYNQDLYEVYKILFLGCFQSGGTSSINLKFNDDTGNNYNHTFAFWSGTTSSATQAYVGTATPVLINSLAASTPFSALLTIYAPNYQPGGAQDRPSWFYQHFSVVQGFASGSMVATDPEYIQLTTSFPFTRGQILCYATPQIATTNVPPANG